MMTDKQILKHIVTYCKGRNVDLKTLNKISETVSMTAQKIKGKLSPTQEIVFDAAVKSWAKGDKTPAEFKGIFRGGN